MMMQEKYREKGQDLHLVFVDLEKAYDRVPRDLIWWRLRKNNVPEGYIKVIQDMYKDKLTQIQTRDGCTDYFRINVGLHQGSALSPLLIIIIMDFWQVNLEVNHQSQCYLQMISCFARHPERRLNKS